MSAVAILEEDVFIGAENNYNIFTVRRNVDATTDEERARLEPAGCFHLGEFVNRFRHGTKKILYATLNTPIYSMHLQVLLL